MNTRIYLDHNASTPLDPAVLEAMLPYLQNRFGNASSLHSWGREVHKAVDDARERVAALLGAQPREVIFTSGGTEANNLALRGAVQAHKGSRNRILTSVIEHASVARPCRALAAAGQQVVFLPIQPDGRLDPGVLEEALDDRTLLVSVMFANNETGALQPIAELARRAHARGALFHCDAVQAPGKAALDVEALGVDLLSLGGHKFYGPHGVGALYVRKGVELTCVTHGADHERGLRPGTPNTPGIVGLGEAARLALERGAEDGARIRTLTARLEAAALRAIAGVQVNGPPLDGRLPNTVNLRLGAVEGEAVLLALDLEGIAISTGSACHSGGVDPSPVLLAMGLGRAEALGSIRVSLGRGTTGAEVDRFVQTLARVVAAQKSARPRD